MSNSLVAEKATDQVVTPVKVPIVQPTPKREKPGQTDAIRENPVEMFVERTLIPTFHQQVQEPDETVNHHLPDPEIVPLLQETVVTGVTYFHNKLVHLPDVTRPEETTGPDHHPDVDRDLPSAVQEVRIAA
jgi:hypothetical protein